MTYTKTCEHCAAEFTVPKWRADKARFCSRACRINGWNKVKRIAKVCDTCGKDFEVLACRTEARFCGNDCRHKGYSFAFTRPRKSYKSEATRTIAQAVVGRRLELMLTQNDVADLANISRATYERVEHGAKGRRRGSSLASAERVLAVLGLRLEVVDASGAKL